MKELEPLKAKLKEIENASGKVSKTREELFAGTFTGHPKYDLSKTVGAGAYMEMATKVISPLMERIDSRTVPRLADHRQRVEEEIAIQKVRYQHEELQEMVKLGKLSPVILEEARRRLTAEMKPTVAETAVAPQPEPVPPAEKEQPFIATVNEATRRVQVGETVSVVPNNTAWAVLRFLNESWGRPVSNREIAEVARQAGSLEKVPSGEAIRDLEGAGFKGMITRLGHASSIRYVFSGRVEWIKGVSEPAPVVEEQPGVGGTEARLEELIREERQIEELKRLQKYLPEISMDEIQRQEQALVAERASLEVKENPKTEALPVLAVDPADSEFVLNGRKLKLTNLEKEFLLALCKARRHLASDKVIKSKLRKAGSMDKRAAKNISYRLQAKIEPDPQNPVILVKEEKGWRLNVRMVDDKSKRQKAGSGLKKVAEVTPENPAGTADKPLAEAPENSTIIRQMRFARAVLSAFEDGIERSGKIEILHYDQLQASVITAQRIGVFNGRQAMEYYPSQKLVDEVKAVFCKLRGESRDSVRREKWTDEEKSVWQGFQTLKKKMHIEEPTRFLQRLEEKITRAEKDYFTRYPRQNKDSYWMVL